MKNKISTFKIVGNSFSFIKKNFGIYASISFLPILFSFIVDLLNQNLVIHFTVPLFIFLFSSYIYVRLAINIHNFAIFGIMPDSYFENLWNKKIKWFWIYAIIIGTPGTITGFFYLYLLQFQYLVS